VTGRMSQRPTSGFLKAAAIVVLISVMAGCAKKVPPPPPPPPVVVIPPRPTPPQGAPENMTIPAVAVDGKRRTVNSELSTAQAVWNLRSAYNVAALNCVAPQYAPILAGYKQFLKVHDKSLDIANASLGRDFKSTWGSESIRRRETYQTQVYNYFAVPPVTAPFCDAAMQVAADLALVPAGRLEAAAPVELAKLEAPFMAFFDAYEQYRRDLEAWQARYGGIVVIAPSQASAKPAGPVTNSSPQLAN